MSERLALDTDAAVDFIRADRPTPPPISRVEQIVLPITVVGELFREPNPAYDLSEIEP